MPQQNANAMTDRDLQEEVYDICQHGPAAPKHSALLWRTNRLGEVMDATGTVICAVGIGDANLIVTAVNSHAALLAAAKKVIATRPFAHSGSAAEDAVKSLQTAIAAAAHPPLSEHAKVDDEIAAAWAARWRL